MALEPVDYEPLPFEEGVSGQPKAPLQQTVQAAPEPLPEPVNYDPLTGAEKALEPRLEGRLERVDYDPLNPAESPLTPTTSDPTVSPPLGTVAGAALGKGFKEGMEEATDFVKAAAAKLRGDPFFKYEPHEQIPTEADDLIKMPVSQGWSDYKWWAAQTLYGAAKSLPIAGGALVGAAVGGGPGAALGGGATAAATSILPAYRQAKERGLSDDEAINEAALMAAVNGGTVALMGGIGLASVNHQAVAQTLAHPIREALLQLGILQPTIGAAGNIAGAMVQGRDASIDEIATGIAQDISMGAMFSIPHIVGATARPLTAREKAAVTPLGTERVETPLPEGYRFEEGVLRTEGTSDIFYSEVARVVEEKGPKSGSGAQWLATIKNAQGVKVEELAALDLPRWLEEAPGKVSKEDLLAHIEEKQVQLEEVVHEDYPPPGQILSPEIQARQTQYSQHRLPGPIAGYGELKLYLPSKRAQLEAEHGRLIREFDEGLAGTPEGRRNIEAQERVLAELRDTEDFEAPHFGPQAFGPGVRGVEGPRGRPGNENLLGWVRYTGRLDRDSKKTLFLEEIQSDWTQKGREFGYRNSELRARLHDQFDAATIPMNKMLEATGRLGFDTSGQAKEAIRADYILASRAGEDPLERIRGNWDLSEAEAQTAFNYAKAWTDLRNQRLAVPDQPFKSSWTELAVKRILRFAADEGYERVAWTNGEMQVARWPQMQEANKAGMREFYDGIVPKLFSKWAKKLGMEGGTTQVTNLEYSHLPPSLVRYVDLSPAASSRVQLGLPLFRFDPGVGPIMGGVSVRPGTEGLHAAARQVIRSMERLAERMGVEDVRFVTVDRPDMAATAGAYSPKYKIAAINLASPSNRTAEAMYATAAHEFGHHIMFTRYNGASNEMTLAIDKAYSDWRARLGANPTLGEIAEAQFNADRLIFNTVRGVDWQSRHLLDLSERNREYWIGFTEWFAEQAARWATTNEKPLSIVDRFFESLGRALRAVLKTVSDRYRRSFDAEEAISNYMNSFLKEQRIGPEKLEQVQLDSIRAAKALFDRAGAPETPATPQDASTTGGRLIADGAGAGEAGREMAAHADRWAKWYNWGLHLIQVAKLNPHITPLQVYTELQKMSHLIANNIRSEAMDTLQAWKNLKEPGQADALGRFIDDYMNARFMPDAERKTGFRRPNSSEMADLIAKHGLSSRAVEVFNRIVSDFDRMLDRYHDLLRREAFRIPDPIKQAEKLEAIDLQIEAMRNRPYMPAFRFGDYTVTVYDRANNVVHFETFQNARTRDAAAKEMIAGFDPEFRVLPGFMRKDARPFLGIPPGMLQLISDKLKLSDSMQAQMKELMFEYAPAQSFRHRFQSKEHVPGYSQDWQRAYANYMFHFSNHYSRVRFIDPMQDMIRAVEKERYTRVDATKIDQIRNFMSAHLDSQMNPKADWAALRGLMFHWYLGFNPAAAAVNLSQTPLVTLPFLAGKFGDVQSFAAMTRATTNMQNFYKKGTYTAASAGEMRAIGEAIREGIIGENQAHELAGISEQRNLLKGFGTQGERAWQQFSEWSAFFFQMAEEYNRRIAFRAAYDLALRNTGSRYVQETARNHVLQFQRLKDRGWTDQEAMAFTAAKDVVESTQYVYAPFARPKMFQGRLGSLFVFKSFLQNTLFLLGNPANRNVAARSLLLMGLAAGLGGLPFSEDLKELVKGIGARFFGKDWDGEDVARRLILDLTKGKIAPDLLLHGASHYGFGMPQVADMIGSLTGFRPPIPNVDLSRSIGMGNISPVNVGRLIQPTKDQSGMLVQEMQRASGAMFGLGFALYNFGASNPIGEPDWKKVEKVLPRFAGNASQAFRFFREGKERNKLGNTVIRFDPSDSIQMAEILAKGLGFQPTRLTERWDNLRAKAEATAFWDLKRESLMRQFGLAVKTKDESGVAELRKRIVEFNRELPQDLKAKAISGEQLRQSVQGRMRAQALQERGLPTNRRNVGIYREIDRLYPGGAVPPGVVDIRKVR